MKKDLQFPTVSIVMPTYNQAGFIVTTIESIRNQTYENWELMIVDDGSDDQTESLIAGLDDERIRFHKAGRIGSIIQLRLIGIGLCSGEFIAFMDSDDLWHPQKLEKQIKVFRTYAAAGFSLTGGYNFRKPGEPLEYFYRQQEGLRYGSVLFSFFTSEVAMLLPTLLFRRSCMKELKNGSYHSDVDFVIALAASFTAVVLFEPLFFRRLHDSNASNSNWERGFTEKIVVIHSSKAKQIIPGSLARKALFKLYINYGEKHLRFQQSRKATGKFFQAWKNRPFSIVPLKKTGKALLSFLRQK